MFFHILADSILWFIPLFVNKKPLIPLCAMGMAMVMQRTKESKKAAATWFRRVMYALTAAFCAMSYLVYTQVGATM